MGKVYRARDTKLNRDVALKIRPDAFATDPQRLARFRREAQVLASLNYPRSGSTRGTPPDSGTAQESPVTDYVECVGGRVPAEMTRENVTCSISAGEFAELLSISAQGVRYGGENPSLVDFVRFAQ